MRNVHVTGLGLPDATSTPSGMPDVSEWKCEKANAQLLWHIVREAIRVEDRPATPETRNGVAGWQWRGDPRRIAERAWDGLDGSDLASDTLSALYDSLNVSGHMGRLDTGNRARLWWVADKWDKLSVYPRVTPKLEMAPVPVEPAAPPLVAVVGGDIDYAAVLQGLLNRMRDLQADNARLQIAASLSEDREELAAEIVRLRGMCEELRESNTALRQQKAADDRMLGRR
jgi:hypothetical protein